MNDLVQDGTGELHGSFIVNAMADDEVAGKLSDRKLSRLVSS